MFYQTVFKIDVKLALPLDQIKEEKKVEELKISFIKVGQLQDRATHLSTNSLLTALLPTESTRQTLTDEFLRSNGDRGNRFRLDGAALVTCLRGGRGGGVPSCTLRRVHESCRVEDGQRASRLQLANAASRRDCDAH